MFVRLSGLPFGLDKSSLKLKARLVSIPVGQSSELLYGKAFNSDPGNRVLLQMPSYRPISTVD